MLGGHLALDLANTTERRTSSRPDDTLRTGQDLARWGARLGILSAQARSPAGTSRELTLAAGLGDQLIALLDALVNRQPAPPASRHALAAATAAAFAAAELADHDGTLAWRWDPAALASVRHRVAVAASELLTGPDATRIGRCSNPASGWFFLDTTKNHTRRWCSMRGCGNKAKRPGLPARRWSRPVRAGAAPGHVRWVAVSGSGQDRAIET